MMMKRIVLNILFKTNLKNKIKGCLNIFNVSAKKLFVSELANNNDNMPNFSTGKSTIYREINKKYPEEINSLNTLFIFIFFNLIV